MSIIATPDELEQSLGENIKTLRLQQNIDRRTLCARAGVSEHALRNLEGGNGTTIKTLVRVLKALKRDSWLDTLAPRVSINPLHISHQKQPRQRARRKKHVQAKEI